MQEILCADSSFESHRPEGHFGLILSYFFGLVKLFFEAFFEACQAASRRKTNPVSIQRKPVVCALVSVSHAIRARPVAFLSIRHSCTSTPCPIHSAFSAE
jgi:hypothetical protein